MSFPGIRKADHLSAHQIAVNGDIRVDRLPFDAEVERVLTLLKSLPATHTAQVVVSSEEVKKAVLEKSGGSTEKLRQAEQLLQVYRG